MTKTIKLGIFSLLIIITAAVILLLMEIAGKNEQQIIFKKYKSTPIVKTTLEETGLAKLIFRSSWRNIPFEISLDEENAVKECIKYATAESFTINGQPEMGTPQTICSELENMLENRPNFFYAEYLLGYWYSKAGDSDKSREFYNRAFEHAPLILVQRYQDKNTGNNLSGLLIQEFTIECNRVKNHSLDPSLQLAFRNLITDEQGCIYVPVYDTVFRRYSVSSPKDYIAEYPVLGWFESRTKGGELPIALVQKKESTI